MAAAGWCLIGIPDHTGVMNVGGRVGAADGPEAFDRSFARLKGRDGVHERLSLKTRVQGMGSEVEANHRQAADLVRDLHRRFGRSVIVGGGHDHGYSHLLGLSEALGPGSRLGCLNIDAHLDVRKPSPKISSGSPFYLAIESGTLDPKRFVEFGIQRHCNAPELWNYVEKKKVLVVPFEDLRGPKAVASFKRALKKLASRCDAVALSLDLDAAAEAHAPGVSAPQAEGFSASDLVQMAEIAGREKKVVSLGLFELNPHHDIGDRTARLAATIAYHFIASRGGRAGGA